METHSEHVTAGPGDAATLPFTEQEWQALRHEDTQAGKAIVLLMAGIFIVGLCLYVFVAWWVS